MAAAISRVEAGEIDNTFWAWLADRDGVDPDDSSTWPVEVAELQPLRKAGVFDGFINARTSELMDAILGTGWHQFGLNPQALLTFPTDAPWELPHTRWHFDLPAHQDPSAGSLHFDASASSTTSVSRRWHAHGRGLAPSRPQDRRELRSPRCRIVDRRTAYARS